MCERVLLIVLGLKELCLPVNTVSCWDIPLCVINHNEKCVCVCVRERVTLLVGQEMDNTLITLSLPKGVSAGKEVGFTY